MFEAEVKEIK